MIEELRKRARRHLQKISTRLANAGCNVDTQFVETASHPAAEILGAIASCDDPLIVLGTHSRDRVERFLVGSTAEEVLRNTDWPVITVGPDVKGSSGLGPLNRLMLATDLTERSFTPIHLLPGLLDKHAELIVVHVSSPNDGILSADWMGPLRSRIAKQLGKATVRFEQLRSRELRAEDL
jgi:hypothetical protein